MSTISGAGAGGAAPRVNRRYLEEQIDRRVERELRWIPRFAAFVGVANLAAIVGGFVYVLGLLPGQVQVQVENKVQFTKFKEDYHERVTTIKAQIQLAEASIKTINETNLADLRNKLDVINRLFGDTSGEARVLVQDLARNAKSQSDAIVRMEKLDPRVADADRKIAEIEKRLVDENRARAIADAAVAGSVIKPIALIPTLKALNGLAQKLAGDRTTDEQKAFGKLLDHGKELEAEIRKLEVPPARP